MLGFIVAYSRAITLLKKWGRKRQDSLLGTPAKFLRHLGVSPDFVSVMSMFFIFLSSVLIFTQSRYYLLTLLAAVCLDMLDGTLARTYPKNRFGGLFDFFLDRFSDSMLLLAFAASGMLGYYFALLLLFFYVLSTLLVKLLESLHVRVYILSFRILAVSGLLLQLLDERAFLVMCAILLLNYSSTALLALPRVMSREE